MKIRVLTGTACLLLLVCCYTSWQIYLVLTETVSPMLSVASERQPRQDQETDVGVVFKPKPLAAYPQTTSRPIFFEGRRIPEPKKEPVEAVATAQRELPPPAPTASPDRLKLSGVQLAKGVRKALLGSPDSNPDWYTIGDSIEGWSVVDIASDRVTIELGGVEGVLLLYPQPNSELTNK